MPRRPPSARTARPAGSLAAIRAKVAPPASQPLTASSVGTPPSGTLRSAWSGLQGSSAAAPVGGRPTSRQFSDGVQPASSAAPSTARGKRDMAGIMGCAAQGAIQPITMN